MSRLKVAVTLVLDLDTINWADEVAKILTRQRKREVTRADAFEYLVLGHWKKTMKRHMEKRHELKEDRKYAEKRFGIVDLAKQAKKAAQR